ncbi:MAG: TatD family hydrolase [Myxococcales bacterium]|nr:TatD family hydrolase [Myxococcales bacterium]
MERDVLEPARWVDSHCHLTADRFDDDREAAIARARDAGVETMVAIGSGYGADGNGEAAALAAAHDDVFATAGVHPHEAADLDDAGRRALRAWLAHERVVAVGECGLDYHYMNSPRDVQREVFAEQVALARELDLPVSIHVRSDDESAYEELLDIWRAEGRGELAGVLHCYTGSLGFAERALREGFYVSFSGIVTFKRSDALREVARAVPLERMLVETDAPFLAPEGHRGRRNEPAWTPLVGAAIAAVHGTTVERVALHTTRNARVLYRLDARESR